MPSTCKSELGSVSVCAVEFAHVGFSSRLCNCNCNLSPTEHLKSAQELVQHVSVHSGSNWNLAVLVFEERVKPEKNFSERGENQLQTQPTYGTGTGNRTRATLVGGECSHHCAFPAPKGWVFEKGLKMPQRN